MCSDVYGEQFELTVLKLQETLEGCVEHPFLFLHVGSALSQSIPTGD